MRKANHENGMNPSKWVQSFGKNIVMRLRLMEMTVGINYGTTVATSIVAQTAKSQQQLFKERVIILT